MVTALQVLNKPSALSDEELAKIRWEAEKLFQQALESAQNTIRRIEEEVRGVKRVL